MRGRFLGHVAQLSVCQIVQFLIILILVRMLLIHEVKPSSNKPHTFVMALKANPLLRFTAVL